MMLVVKKRNLLFTAFLILLLFFLSGAAYHYFSVKTFLPSEGRTVIIDAGHGAPDGGAVTKSGVEEKDLNLSVAMFLQEYFEQSGTNVILTRSDDNGIYEQSDSIRNKKRSDLKNREKIIKNSGADAVISIHMNEFSESEYSGPQVFFSKNNERSERLADFVQTSMNEALKPSSARDYKKAEDGIYLLKKAQIPAVLVECGFLSNPEEQQKLLNEQYRQKVAWSIYCGALKYFEENDH